LNVYTSSVLLGVWLPRRKRMADTRPAKMSVTTLRAQITHVKTFSYNTPKAACQEADQYME
jgi:hypothetical protein